MKFPHAAVLVALLVFAGSAMAAPIVFSCNTSAQENTERYATHMCPQFSEVGLLSVPLDLSGEILTTIVFLSGGDDAKIETATKNSDFSLESLVGSIFSPSFSVESFTIDPSRPAD